MSPPPPQPALPCKFPASLHSPPCPIPAQTSAYTWKYSLDGKPDNPLSLPSSCLIIPSYVTGLSPAASRQSPLHRFHESGGDGCYAPTCFQRQQLSPPFLAKSRQAPHHCFIPLALWDGRTAGSKDFHCATEGWRTAVPVKVGHADALLGRVPFARVREWEGCTIKAQI